MATAHKERTRCSTLTSSMLPKLHSGALGYERFAKSITSGILGRQCRDNGYLGDVLKIDANDPSRTSLG